MTENQFLKLLAEIEPIIKAESYKYHIPGMEPDDIQQEIRLRLWLKYSTFKGRSSFKTWANKVIKNCIKNLMRDSQTDKSKALNTAISLDEFLDELDESD